LIHNRQSFLVPRTRKGALPVDRENQAEQSKSPTQRI
jgi:hypothetical protein